MADAARRRAARQPFGARYAALYDELYAEKDYAAECRYLERLFERFGARRVRSVLSLGCGTGGHDLLLARRGFEVTGVDRSPGMLAAYRAKARAAGIEPDVVRGDVRRVRLARRFDAVISMFAVIGYQVSDADLAGSFATAAAHLRRGGLFVFDVWYGPAVLADPPRERTKTIAAANGERVVRHTRCALDELAQTVAITFETERLAGARRLERVVESHPMRFFFPRELGLALADAGLGVTAIVPFGRTRGRPSTSDWTVTVLAKRL